MSKTKYQDIILTIEGQIGTIKVSLSLQFPEYQNNNIQFNRPKALNSFGGKLMAETIAAMRELNDHPDTVFTVLTGEGRFFSAGADVRGSGLTSSDETYASDAEKKLEYITRFAPGMEMLRSIIDHKKVFVVALNGPAVGGGAAWFTGSSDILLASSSTYLQINFSSLGLVPEYGSAINFAQSMGVHRANEMLMFGRKLTAEELQQYGIVNHIFPVEGFQESVKGFLQEQLKANDGKSMMEVKRLQNAPLRDGRLVAVVNAMDALAERFVEGAPKARFAEKKKQLEANSKKRASKI
ncbi:Enoyl-CoA delta isomerase 2, mitochondrial [Lachnellula occidentalis]|uniref:Enoyl-CoA delta isomerase 2, mitochondrial n=1 Tax=Lachnellula occidentalis TaxID=215460 RepID=A0A8H8UJ92_9HELO|nr:Enoyl-CoA delta isomerase 2, mitochondrial [Lachnellula occidentalis]